MASPNFEATLPSQGVPLPTGLQVRASPLVVAARRLRYHGAHGSRLGKRHAAQHNLAAGDAKIIDCLDGKLAVKRLKCRLRLWRTNRRPFFHDDGKEANRKCQGNECQQAYFLERQKSSLPPRPSTCLYHLWRRRPDDSPSPGRIHFNRRNFYSVNCSIELRRRCCRDIGSAHRPDGRRCLPAHRSPASGRVRRSGLSTGRAVPD